MDRQTELEANLREVNRDIDAVCQKYGRDRSEVRLIVVTKTWPASDVELLAKLGVTDVGENRDQEAKPKHAEVTAKLTWHAIGQLQTNKAKSVATWADVVHSVDRIDLVNALAKAVTSRQTPLRCLIQVNLVCYFFHIDILAKSNLNMTCIFLLVQDLFFLWFYDIFLFVFLNLLVFYLSF